MHFTLPKNSVYVTKYRSILNQVPIEGNKKIGTYTVKKKLYKRNENYENINKDKLQEQMSSLNDNLRGAKTFIHHLDYKQNNNQRLISKMDFKKREKFPTT